MENINEVVNVEKVLRENDIVIDWAKTIDKRLETCYYEAKGSLFEDLKNLKSGTTICIWDDRQTEGIAIEVEFISAGKAEFKDFKRPEKVLMIKYPGGQFPTFTSFDNFKDIVF